MRESNIGNSEMDDKVTEILEMAMWFILIYPDSFLLDYGKKITNENSHLQSLGVFYITLFLELLTQHQFSLATTKDTKVIIW